MKIFLKVMFLLLFSCGIIGCGQYYYQEVKTYKECTQDFSECHSDLLRYADPSKNGQGKSEWGSYERKFVDDCMEQRGYKLVTENDLQLHVKRQDSDWLGWHHGFAGLLDEQ
jgi:hypothetical protein